MDVKDAHPEKALLPINVTEEGTVTDVRLEHSEKALFPIDVRFDVIFTVFKLIQPLNV